MPAGRPVEDAVRPRDAARERVDQDVAVVARVELQLAADGGHADGVAVAADACDDAPQELGRARVVRPAEAERIEAGDGARAHREDVAHDAADAGRGALVGLDEARVVVRLHLEDGGEPVADVDHAGVLAGPLDDARPLGRQAPKVHAARLVRAVLAPHHAEHPELGVRGVASQRLPTGGELSLRQLVLCDEGGRDCGVVREARRGHGRLRACA